MALTPIENVGAGGLVSDIKPYQLQPNQWSGASNVSFRNGEVSKVNGYQEVMKDCPIDPWHLGTYQQMDAAGRLGIGGFFWLAFGEKKIYANWLDEWYNVTRQDEDGNDVDYNTESGTDWDVTQSGTLLIATNTVDIPQIWQLNQNNKVEVSLPFKDLSTWVTHNTPGETELSCQTVEGFKNHIIISGPKRDVGPATEELNRTIKWSTPHSHYSEPASWNVIDDKYDAGEYELLDTQGPIIDTLPMGELFMIYKSDSVYMMSYVGTPYMFSFKTLDPQVGIAAKGAAVEFPGGHFFASLSDCYINNGQSIVPILTGKVRNEMFNNINGEFYHRMFCVADIATNEIWACYPTVNSEYCDRAMVWNYKENTFTFRELPDTTDIKSGVKKLTQFYDKDDPSTITWDSSDPDPSVPEVPWTSVTTMSWGSISYSNVVSNLVMCSPSNVKLYRDNAGQKEDDKLMYAYVERTGIDMGDPSTVKHLRAVWPKIATLHTHTIDVYTGSQMGTDEPVRWEGPHRFDPDNQSKISVRTTGKLLAMRFETKADTKWTISGIELETEVSGSRGSRKYA